MLVPPVTGPALYQPAPPKRADLFNNLFHEDQPLNFYARMRAPRARPSYTDSTLAVAIREGKDPSGRRLDPLMPRYVLRSEDMRRLIAYLKMLSRENAPGVTSSEIHFATIVTDGLSMQTRQDMISMIASYFRRKNADVDRELERPGHSPLYKDDYYPALRKWVLHLWELKGSRATWAQQLDKYYRDRPVFTLVSGAAAGPWKLVHEFCERREIPCVFPNTDLPVISPQGVYSLYFSEGVTLEAAALASYLANTAGLKSRDRIVQIYSDSEEGRTAASALHTALHRRSIDKLEDYILTDGSMHSIELCKSLSKGQSTQAIVLWLPGPDTEALGKLEGCVQKDTPLYFSSTLLNWERKFKLNVTRNQVSREFYLIYPFALELDKNPGAYRATAFSRSRSVSAVPSRLQLNTYFAVAVIDDSLSRIGQHFSRDYFIENIERQTESMENSGVFPHLSLGPGQRFASKGSYIVRIPKGSTRSLEPVSSWIVP